MQSTHSAHDQNRHSARRLWWYVLLTRVALALAVGAFIAFMLGLFCVPGGFVSPKQASSLFLALQANGAFVNWPRRLFGVAALLATLSVFVRLVIRISYWVKHE